MDLTNRTDIKNLLEKYGAKPEKYLGQHFLLSKRALRQMVGAADIQKSDTIVEIGPGLGVLTQELAKTGARVIAIEKDILMNKILQETLADDKNASVTQADARKINWDDISTLCPQIRVGPTYEARPTRQCKYKIVANLPYNIANFLIRNWLESKNQPERIVVMVQKEVARRICPTTPRLRRAGAKQPKMNLLAVSVQFFAEAKIINYVPAEVFWPKPKVDSAILLITPYSKGRNNSPWQIIAAQSEKFKKRFFEILKAGFSQPRKQLAGNLVKKLPSLRSGASAGKKISREKIITIFKDLDISEKTRAENLSIDNWILLTKNI